VGIDECILGQTLVAVLHRQVREAVLGVRRKGDKVTKGEQRGQLVVSSDENLGDEAVGEKTQMATSHR
jgi:hypothetical protein